jgi:hypothetical protein
MPFPLSSSVNCHGPLLTVFIPCACFPLAWPAFAVPFLGHFVPSSQPWSSYAKMAAQSKMGWTKKISHSCLVSKWNNVAKTSIPYSAHLQSLLLDIVQYLETSSDDDDDDDDDGIACRLQHLLKSRNYASASSSPIATHDYDNNNDMLSSSDHSTVGDSSSGGSNNDYEDNDDANDANDAHDPFSCFASSDDSPSSDPSSICDGTHSEDDYNDDDDNDYTFAYASSTSHAAGGNNHNAVGGTSIAINDCNNCNAVGGNQ